MTGVTAALLAVLLAAALLGALLGAAVTLLSLRQRVAGDERRAREAARREADERVREVEATASAATEALAHERTRHAASRRRADLLARQVASVEKQVQGREQALHRRIAALLDEQRSAEEHQARLQRALDQQQAEFGFAVPPAGRADTRSDGARAASPASSRTRTRDPAPFARASDGSADVPVLNRRAGALHAEESRAGRAAHAAHAGLAARGAASHGAPAIGSRLPAFATLAAGTPSEPIDENEFPSLSEAELPDDIDVPELAAAGDGDARPARKTRVGL